jgi:hypothetical protein
MANNDPLWIEHANLDKGSLTAKAKRASESMQSFARSKASSPGKLGKQSRLAQTLSGLRKSGVKKERI